MGHEWKPIFYLYQGNYDILIEDQKGDENVLNIAYFQLGQFEKAGPGGKIILAVIYKSYSEVISLLNEALDMNFPIGCLDIEDLLILKAYCCYCLGEFKECKNILEKAEELVSRN